MDLLKQRLDRKRAALRAKLSPGNWAIDGEWIELPEPTKANLAELEAALEGRVLRAGLREAEIGEHVDEGQLGELSYVRAGEYWAGELAGLIAISVHVASGSTKTWIYKPGTRLELPHAIAELTPAVA